MSEPRGTRRKGRGIDAIFDATDLNLEPSTEDLSRSDEGRGSEVRASEGRGSVREETRVRRAPGRPKSEQPPTRQLVQRGFYLEPEQDRMIDEIKVALKGRNFNPDRSAIIRAAVEHFQKLDRFEQEERVRRVK